MSEPCKFCHSRREFQSWMSVCSTSSSNVPWVSDPSCSWHPYLLASSRGLVHRHFCFRPSSRWRGHAVVEERVILGEVDDIEGVLLVDHHAFHWKEEPLIVASRIDIVTHDQVVFELSDLSSDFDTLKAANKFPLSNLESNCRQVPVATGSSSSKIS